MKRNTVSEVPLVEGGDPVRTCSIPTKSYRWGLMGFNPLSGVDGTRQRWFRTRAALEAHAPSIYPKGRWVAVRAPL